MILFFNLILQVFKTYHDKDSVKSNDTSYSYKDILIKVYFLVQQLKNTNPAPMRVGLVAHNSIEWVIVFLAVILSGNKLVLFSPLTSKAKLKHMIINANLQLLFTDYESIEEIRNPITTIVSITKLRYVLLNSPEAQHIESYECIIEKLSNYHNELIKGIIVYSPKSIYPVIIPYTHIILMLDVIREAKIFDKTTNYVAYPEFTYNYILGFLLPFIEGINIVIPTGKFSTHDAKWQFNTYLPEIVILNAYQFEQIWREFIEPSTNELLKFLAEYELVFIQKWILKKRIKSVFPDMEKLIILNSSLSTTMESTLKSMKVPYTITYGSVETCGLVSYSDPKDFKIGTLGKIINPFIDINDICNDTISVDENLNIISSDEEYTEFEFTASKYEKILKGLPLVTDCILTKFNNELILLVNIDTQYVDTYGICLSEVKKRLEICRKEVNSKVNSSRYLNRIIIELVEFKRDSNGRIMREYYEVD